MIREDIVREALGLVGTNYVHQGRLKGIGIDCIGVGIVVCRALGLVEHDFDVTGYPSTPDGTFTAQCEQYMTRIKSPQAGDAGVYRFGIESQHFGILVPYRHGGLSLVHAMGPGHPKKVLETRLMPRMIQMAAFRLPGVA